MIRYWLGRLGQALLTCLAVSVGTFVMLHAAPGDPVDVLAPPELAALESDKAELARMLGLDQPLAVQYITMTRQLLTGQLRSFHHQRSTLQQFAEAAPTTLTIVFLALIVSTVLALGVAIVSATRPYGWLDNAATTASLFGLSVPSFWFALLLVYVFSEQLGWLPATGIRPPISQAWDPREMLPYLIMPVSVTALAVAPIVMRYARSALLEVLGQQYILVARSKGLPERIVLLRHALRNALIPVVTVVGLLLPILLSGSPVIETIFALPGVGRLAVEAALGRDFPLVMTATTITTVLVVVSSLLVDLVYIWLDPRIRYQ